MIDPSVVLSVEQIAQLLRMTPAMLRAGISMAPAAVLSWHPGPGEWCIKEVLGHLIEAEQRGFAGRIRTILDHQDPALEGWDQGEVARARRDCEREYAELLVEFQMLRDDSINLAIRLSAEDLRRGGNHPLVGYLVVADLLQEWVFHDQVHLRQMLANVQSYVWPHMGAARRFYTD